MVADVSLLGKDVERLAKFSGLTLIGLHLGVYRFVIQQDFPSRGLLSLLAFFPMPGVAKQAQVLQYIEQHRMHSL